MENVELKIYDLLGNEVLSSSIQYPVSSIQLNLPAGVYFIKLQTNDGSYVQKIVKLK